MQGSDNEMVQKKSGKSKHFLMVLVVNTMCRQYYSLNNMTKMNLKKVIPNETSTATN